MRKLKNSELNRIDISTFKSIKKTPLIVVLDDIRSLNNVGSIFRTCDAFLIKKFICVEYVQLPQAMKLGNLLLDQQILLNGVMKQKLNL